MSSWRRARLAIRSSVVAWALLLAFLTLPSGAQAQVGDQAHGVATVAGSSHCPPGSTATYDFSATSGPSGENASGVFSHVCSPTGSFPSQAFSGSVSCLQVTGNVATLGGTVTASTSPAFPVGTELSFTVTDGGPAGLNDGISVFSQGANCVPDLAFRPISSGDIVVVDGTPTEQDAAIVVLTPPAAVNPVGTQHTVTATATTATSGPAAGVTIRFSVLGASDAQGTCTTDAQGQCTFTYMGPELPGADLITGCADNDDSGTTDPGEPCGEATKIWMLPATTPGQVTGGGWITVDGNRVSFGFNAQSAAAAGAAKGNCNVIDHATKTQIKCKTVDSLLVTPTHATFFGQATTDGEPTDYRIDVDDLGEPGLADTFKIQTDSGYTAAGTLRGGNIQIHR
jgi:hypothetical protein